MKTFTEEELKQVDYIPTSRVKQDIIDTQKEIDQYESELISLQSNPVENKLAIYFREGKILQRKDFILKLEQILNYRLNKSVK